MPFGISPQLISFQHQPALDQHSAGRSTRANARLAGRSARQRVNLRDTHLAPERHARHHASRSVEAEIQLLTHCITIPSGYSQIPYRRGEPGTSLKKSNSRGIFWRETTVEV